MTLHNEYVITLYPGEPPKFHAASAKFDLRWISTLIDDDIVVAAFCIQPPSSDYDLVGWVDDNGLDKQMPLNFFRWSALGDPIVGPCIITREGRGPEGELAPVTESDMLLVRGMLVHTVYKLRSGKFLPTRILRAPRAEDENVTKSLNDSLRELGL